MAPNPAILIIHGAWCLPDPCYTPLKSQLEGLGYDCYLPKLFTAGGDEVAGKSWQSDVKDILDTAIPLFEQGREVTIIAHSYGGVPAAVATEGQGVEDRARRGETGGFRQIIYVAAFAMPQKGMDLLTLFGGKWPTWGDFGPAYTKNQTVKLNEEAKALFFSDLAEAEQQKFYGAAVLQSQDAFETPVSFSAADITIPKSYLVCTQDLCVPGPLQEHLAQSLGFKFEKMDAGHFPFLSQPQQCLDLLKRMLI